MGFFYFIIFIFGLMVGSFLNSIIYRLSSGESFLIQRSYCPHCKHILSWEDLIPLFSFIILRGKCRYCRQKISWQYPLVEIATGSLFLLIFNFQLPSVISEGEEEIYLFAFNFLNLIYYLVIACFLIIIFVYDLKHYIIPDKIIYPAIATAIFYQLFGILNLEIISDFGFRISDLKPLLNPLLSAILASLFFLLIALVSGGKWLGLGDVKLAFFMGLFLGFPNVLFALFLAFSIGAIIGIGLIIAGKKTLKSEVPFGPFLVAGTFIALFWGRAIIDWYLGFI